MTYYDRLYANFECCSRRRVVTFRLVPFATICCIFPANPTCYKLIQHFRPIRGSSRVPNIDILVLAILQGATEFLPVSSSGHFLMAPQLYCWGTQSPALELAALLGALVAVMVCFAGDLIGMAQGFLKVLQGKRDGRVRLIGLLLVAGDSLSRGCVPGGVLCRRRAARPAGGRQRPGVVRPAALWHRQARPDGAPASST